ncbi:MAG TPA: phenylacetate--CoA ligase [Candidatus Paceibacterota bacterium]|nr:phenylacetate--CoA ligase [Verrucomicrobiota bacterium]HRY50093.1 phenylacetate--CoA ligase [Candidatus Paceibacterota bacterium]HRZ99435.1 phenylacetate--CoA ligase [Candidatus Paceibacterota bacterium]
MFWDKSAETIDRSALEKLQLTRLQETVGRVLKHVPFYQQQFAQAAIPSDVIRELADIRRLPFTTNADLRAQYPRGFLVGDGGGPVRLHTSSGTTGKPKAIFFSRGDIDRAANLAARCLVMSGNTDRDILQNMMTYGLFTGALMMHYGAEKVGMMVIPAGPGNSEKQLLLMQDFSSTVFHTTPSYALYFADFMEKKGVDPRRDLSLKRAFIGAEPYSEETRRKIEEAFGIEVYNSYGLSEMNGPGVAFECAAKQGMHLWEDHFLMEVLDPVTNEPVPEGCPGELVLTTLCREAMPLIRYRTRDITSVVAEPCSCGRTHRRIRRITGRTDDMLIVRGANIYPQQIERILMSVPGVGRNYLICLSGLDEMTVKVELSASEFDGRVERLVHLQTQLTERLRAEIMVKPLVELVPPGSLPPSEGKAKRVIDNRAL